MKCIECRCYRCNLWLTTLHTCEQPATFPPTVLKKITDYARVKLKNHEYINIRGISCKNCRAATKQGNLSSWTSNSYKSKTEFGCDLDGSPSVNGSENNFGKYRLNTNNSDPPIAVRHLLPLQLSIGLDLSTACKP